MNRFRVVEDRTDITRGSEVKSFLLGYDVWEYDGDNEVQKMNQRVLGQQGARELAATLTWMVHLDKWMISVVEDADVTDEVAEILEHDDFPPDGADDQEIEKAYDRMTASALKFLPAGLRRLADRYEQEWEKVSHV